MIVEMTGLPGAGKTTCERHLCEQLQQRGYKVLLAEPDVLRYYVRDRIYARYWLSYELRRFRVVRAVVSLMYRAHLGCAQLRDQLAIGRLVHAWSKAKRFPCRWLSQDMLLSRYYLEEFCPRDKERYVYLASEGLAHHGAATAVFAGARYPAIGNRWLTRHSGNDLIIIHLQVPLPVALERLWQRGVPLSWPRKVRRNKNLVQETLRRFADAIEASIRQYQAAGARVFTIDNSGDVACLATLVARLADCLPHAPRLSPRAAKCSEGRDVGGDGTDAEERILRH